MLDQIIDEGVGYLSPRQGSRFIAPTTNGPVGADLSRPSPIYRPQVNTSNPITASETTEGVGADLSRPSPIYRPQVNTSNSIITSETTEGVGADLSRPSPIYRLQVNTSNPITASETTEIDSEQTHYVVRLPAFEGPLNLLLYLIEKR